MTATTISLRPDLKEALSVIASNIRGLSMDAVEKAGSGHAGTPMGCADIAAYLYGCFLRYNPQNTHWVNRDRFILSAGHASLLQYSCLHFMGILSIEELKQFRQLGSRTPSHPQYRTTPGIETTTGVDGQGVSHGVGQALGIKMLGERLNRPSFSLYNAKVIVLAGDGCLMEGVSHEVCSLAGHWNLDNLILVYDRNKTCLDGLVSESSSENTRKRYEGYGWEVHEIDGHDFDAFHRVFSHLRDSQSKPTLIIADTVIGKGAPTKAGSYLIHSEPVGREERTQAKKALGLPDTEFYVSESVYAFFQQKRCAGAEMEIDWDKTFEAWKRAYPDLYDTFEKMRSHWVPKNLEKHLADMRIPAPISGRKASGLVLNFLGDLLPSLYGGSADLARSDMTHMHHHSVVSASEMSGRNIKYGVREFGMGGIAIGLAQTDMIRPFVGTFLAFSDYMLNPIRMAALMRVPVVYQFTHDSIFVGQDGPTHQPVEHLSHLRAIPGLQVIRPADANEVKMAWIAALKYSGPTAIILSRQDLPICIGTSTTFEKGVGRGAYALKESPNKPVFTLIGTGSEVNLALLVAEALEKQRISTRVISMPSWDLFENQPKDYQERLLGANSGVKVSIEAGSEIGWHKYVLDGKVFSVKTFGKSASPQDLAREYGFTTEEIVKQLLPLRSRL